MTRMKFSEMRDLITKHEKGIRGKELNAADAAHMLKTLKIICAKSAETRNRVIRFLVNYVS